MKKALLPLTLILIAIAVFAVAGYLYDQKFGAEGPFPNEHHHGGGAPDEHEGHDHADPHDHESHQH